MPNQSNTPKTCFEIRGEQKGMGIILYNVFETRKLARQWLNRKPAHKKDCRIYKVRIKPNRIGATNA